MRCPWRIPNRAGALDPSGAPVLALNLTLREEQRAAVVVLVEAAAIAAVFTSLVPGDDVGGEVAVAAALPIGRCAVPKLAQPSVERLKASPPQCASGLALLGAASFEQLTREVEAEAEVVDEVEDGEGQNKGVGVGHLPEYRCVARQPQGGERQGELAEGDRARRVDVADRDEDQERAGHEHGGEHQRAGMKDDGVEGDDVEVAWEAEEVMIFGLGVNAAELVA